MSAEAGIQLAQGIFLPLAELSWEATRSGGPGGQNVNKVATRVTVTLDLTRTCVLSAEQKQRLHQRLSGRISRSGLLRVTSQRHRSQAANRRAAVVRLGELIGEALSEAAPRRATRPSSGGRNRRLARKRRHGLAKQARRKPVAEG